MPEETQETLIQEETTSTETGPSEEKQESTEDLAARLAKAEEEKENYKKMALKYKEEAKPKTLEVEEEYPDWDEQSKKFQKQTIDLAQKAAEVTTRHQVEKVNEKNAIAQFIEQNPELADDSKWQEVIKNYQPRSKESVQDILKDLGRAKVLAEYESGTPAKELKPDVSDMATVGKTTSKSATEGHTLTQSEIQMAKNMRVDTEKLAAEDMSKPATIEL
jgi:hypothetical protein